MRLVRNLSWSHLDLLSKQSICKLFGNRQRQTWPLDEQCTPQNSCLDASEEPMDTGVLGTSVLMLVLCCAIYSSM